MESALSRKYSQVFQSAHLGADPRRVYSARRQALLGNLSSLCLFAGVERVPGSEEVWAYNYERRIQDPAFLFLTGVNQPGAFLVLDPLSRDPDMREILFLPEKNPSREFWEGAMLGISAADPAASIRELIALTGVRSVLPARQFWGWIRKRVAEIHRDHIFGFWHEYTDGQTHKLRQIKDDHNWAFRTKLATVLQKVAPNIALQSVAPLHLHHRMALDRHRIVAARKAQEITGQAFRNVLAKLTSLPSERSVAALLEYEMLQHTNDGLAFPTIVASGKNACILHYSKCDEPLEKDRLVLLDFGMRVGSLCSDISRTVPANGTFNPLQRLLYQIVLDTQLFHQASVKPGKTLRQLNLASWDFLEEQLRLRFLSKGGQMRRQYPMLSKAPVDPQRPLSKGPHGISHLIGEQVHEGDPFRVYQDQMLRPGMMISNEPGLYGYFVAEFAGVRFEETIGIRIEDDLLITAKGCQNLSHDIPKHPDELELLLQNKWRNYGSKED